MSRELTRKKLKQDEFVEGVFSIEQWVEDHWKTLAKWTGGIAAVALIASGWVWWGNRNAAEASRLFGDALKEYRAASTAAVPSEGFDRARALFEDAAGRAGGAAEWSADFYRASTLLEMDKTDEAIALLEGLTRAAPDPILTASSQLLLANAYESAGRADEALDTLRTVADDDTGFSAQALLQLGTMQAQAGQSTEARATLEDVTSRYPTSGAAVEARRVLQRLSF
jgi:TolA-binding protein